MRLHFVGAAARLCVRFVDHWLYSKEPLPPFKISGILFCGCSQLHFVK